LLTFFRDANDWDAIVLLDEADIYLERRATNDLKRNSIVSGELCVTGICYQLLTKATVFLRALDYFQGILFLTTNRVGAFDEAFMSRIHVQIGYDPLDDHARNAIWENNFRKLKEDHDAGGREIQHEWDAKEYVKKSKEVKELQWNGREIRNGMCSLTPCV
jgi:SpoVK/Ycf46/Vps4 family AAA+-type ATPase